MARINCQPCEIIPIVCDCCHEILCYCSTNKVIRCIDPCFPESDAHYPGGAPLPYFIEGMVPDANFDAGFSNHVIPGPLVSSIITSAWDPKYNLFSYQEINDYLIGSNGRIISGSYINDISSCTDLHDSLTTNRPFANAHLGPKINTVVDDLLSKSKDPNETFENYATQGSNLGNYVWRSPTNKVPYNEQIFYLLKNSSFIYDSISNGVETFLESIKYKNVTSYSKFRNKYMAAITKSILIGQFNKYFPEGKMEKIKSFSEQAYLGKAVTIINTVSSLPSQLGFGTTSSINLGNSKTYISETRRRFNSGQSGQRLTNNVLKQYWKFVPSDINLRARVYRDNGAATSALVTSLGGSFYNIAGLAVKADEMIQSIKVNDDDTISTHRPDGTTARVHYINAEHLRVFNNSGAHVYLDETPRYQSGCNCCTSGCFVSLCSDRDRSYVFDTMDRTQLLGVLGAVSGAPAGGFDTDPYIKLTVSAPYTSGLEFKYADGALGQAQGKPPLTNWYLLTPNLSGIDTLSSTVDPDNPYVKTTTLPYKIESNGAFLNTIGGVVAAGGQTRMVDRAVRFISGPGNVCFVENDDPFLYYLQGVWAATNTGGVTQRVGHVINLSATIPDLNIDGIMDSDERYPRRIPYHILVVPTDQPEKNPFVGKSRITKMVSPSGYNPFRGDDGIVRELKFVPAPTEDVLNSNYLDLVTNDEAISPPTGFSGIEIDKFPYGPQGTAMQPYKMQFSASNVHESFDVWTDPSGTTEEYTRTNYLLSSFERNRRVDPIRKVWDFIGDVCSYYDTAITRLWGSLNPPYTQYPPPFPVGAQYGLPLFDVWRSLNIFEFHEFLFSFRDDLFQQLTADYAPPYERRQFFDLRLFYMPNNAQEKTYLHNYVPGAPTWNIPIASTFEYSGTVANPRNASGIDFIESALYMDKAKERDC